MRTPPLRDERRLESRLVSSQHLLLFLPLPLFENPLLSFNAKVFEFLVDQVDLLVGKRVRFPIDEALQHADLRNEGLITAELVALNLLAILLKQLLIHDVQACLFRLQVKDGAEYLEKVLRNVLRVILLV